MLIGDLKANTAYEVQLIADYEVDSCQQLCWSRFSLLERSTAKAATPKGKNLLDHQLYALWHGRDEITALFSPVLLLQCVLLHGVQDGPAIQVGFVHVQLRL